MIHRIFIIVVILIALGCSNNSQKSVSAVTVNLADTLNDPKHDLVTKDSMKNGKPSTLHFESLEKTAKKELEMIEMAFKKDTLSIVSASWFFYYPFGKFNSIVDFKKHNNSFDEVIVYDKSDSTDDHLYRVIREDSFVKLIKSSDTEKLEIVSGSITNKKIILANGVRIGMHKKPFLEKLFNKLPYSKEIDEIKVVEIISGLNGIWHYYDFNNDILERIRFDTDYLISKE